MEVFKIIGKRRSIRLYEKKPVEKEKLNRILEAGRLAPSADNKQPWRFVVVTNNKVKENMILTATELGLGTCWIADFDEEAARKAIKLPSGIRVVAMTPLGHPAKEKHSLTNRKPLTDIVHYEHW